MVFHNDYWWGAKSFYDDAYPTKHVHATTIGLAISIRKDEFPTILVQNGYFHNKVHTKPIETLEAHHFNGFKTIHEH